VAARHAKWGKDPIGEPGSCVQLMFVAASSRKGTLAVDAITYCHNEKHPPFSFQN